MTDSNAVEVVDAELVDEEENRALPVPAEAPAPRPLVGRHTLLRPNAPISTAADLPVYPEADCGVRRAPGATGHGALVRPGPHVGDPLRPPGRPAARYEGGPADPPQARPGLGPAPHAREGAADPYRGPVRHGGRLHRGRRPQAAEGPPGAALLTLGWGMPSRRSELANLLVEHLAVEDDGVTVRVAFSRTDRAAHGEDTFVPDDPDDPALCPVVRVRAWLEELRRRGITSGPPFRHITRGGTIRPHSGPRDDFLSPDAIENIVKSRARLAGIKAPDGRAVTAHGLHRGPAQEISEAGGDLTAQGRWKPGSPTVHKHSIEPARGRTNNPLHAVRAKPLE